MTCSMQGEGYGTAQSLLSPPLFSPPTVDMYAARQLSTALGDMQQLSPSHCRHVHHATALDSCRQRSTLPAVLLLLLLLLLL